jgi:hypothetical protein
MKESQMDEILAGTSSPAQRMRSETCQTPAPVNCRPSTVPSTPGSATRLPPCSQVAEKPRSRLQGTGVDEGERQQVKDAKLIKEIFEPSYQELIALLAKPDPEYVRRKGLERFECGKLS